MYPDINDMDVGSNFQSSSATTAGDQISTNDLVATLKNVHYSVVAKLTDSYIKEYDDKLDLL